MHQLKGKIKSTMFGSSSHNWRISYFLKVVNLGAGRTHPEHNTQVEAAKKCLLLAQRIRKRIVAVLAPRSWRQARYRSAGQLATITGKGAEAGAAAGGLVATLGFASIN